MTWIESHQSLHTHRKTLRAAEQLNVAKYLLIGHLHALWWWGLDNAANNGDLGDVTGSEIAAAAGWPRNKSAAFVDALLAAGGKAKPGFLERTEDGYALHNWHKYAGKLNEKRAKDRARKAEVAGSSTGNPTEVAEKSQAPTPPNPPTVPTHLTDLPGGGGARRNIFVLYEDCFGPIFPGVVEELKAYEDEYPPGCIEHCFSRAKLVVPRPKSLGYVKAMLQTHQREGCDVRAPRNEPVASGPAIKSYRYDD